MSCARLLGVTATGSIGPIHFAMITPQVSFQLHFLKSVCWKDVTVLLPMEGMGVAFIILAGSFVNIAIAAANVLGNPSSAKNTLATYATMSLRRVDTSAWSKIAGTCLILKTSAASTSVKLVTRTEIMSSPSNAQSTSVALNNVPDARKMV